MRSVAHRVVGILVVGLLVASSVSAADDKHSLTGTWKGHYQNTAGGGDKNSKLVLEEYKSKTGKQIFFKGHWDKAAVERGVRKGNQINWSHLNDKDNKVYVVTGTISGDGKTLKMEYTVKSKAGKTEYTGTGTYKR